MSDIFNIYLNLINKSNKFSHFLIYFRIYHTFCKQISYLHHVNIHIFRLSLAIILLLFTIHYKLF